MAVYIIYNTLCHKLEIDSADYLCTGMILIKTFGALIIIDN